MWAAYTWIVVVGAMVSFMAVGLCDACTPHPRSGRAKMGGGVGVGVGDVGYGTGAGSRRGTGRWWLGLSERWVQWRIRRPRGGGWGDWRCVWYVASAGQGSAALGGLGSACT